MTFTGRFCPNGFRILIPLALAPLVALAAVASGAAAEAADDGFGFEVKVSHEAASEQQERDVDEVALSAQDKAITRIQQMLKKYRGTPQEPILLTRLAELQQQSGAIVFRIEHGQAAHKNKAVDLTRYYKAMKLSITTLNSLLAKYPKFEEIPHACFMRGKAYEEVKDETAAAKDYIFLTEHFPESEDTTPAYMSLADFAIEANDHPRAIHYLEQVEKRPEDPFFPFALYKLAWSHYNLKDIAGALSYSERQIAYYDSRSKKDSGDGDLATSDVGLKENTLLDVTVFYLDGLELDSAKYSLDKAMAYFRKLDKNSKAPVLGRMLVRFAKLLRSHEHERELVDWTNEVIAEEPKRQESLEVLLITYEHEMNNRRFDALVASAKDIVKLQEAAARAGVKYESLPRAQKFLLDTAEWLQALIIKNRKSDQVRPLSVTLASIYESFTKVVEDSDPRIPRVHYNLAETLFAIRDYDGAAHHYRWVVEHGDWNESKGAKLLTDAAPASPQAAAKKPKAVAPEPGQYATVVDASLKAIAARYEVLQEKKLIPISLQAVPESKNSDRALDPALSEWIAWIDEHAKHSAEGTDNFLFEANRALYASGHVTDSIRRMKAFAIGFPASNYAISSASLVIDTRIAGQEWEATHQLANELMDVKEWKHADFGKRLYSVASDAYFKMMEERYTKNDYRGALDMADTFLERYPTSARVSDVLSLAGSSAMIDAQKDRAMGYYSRLIVDSPKSAGAGPALLARASVEEDHYEFSKAAMDYRTYLSLASEQIKPEKIKNDEKHLSFIRKKTAMLAWLSGDDALLTASLANKAVCPESIASECQKYRVLGLIAKSGGLSEEAANDAYDHSRDSEGDLKTLYATLALQGVDHLVFHHRLWAARYAAEGWDELDPLIKYTLVPYLSSSIPVVFALDRREMNDFAPLRANDKFITHRVDAIREVETAGAQVMKLPWARIRAEVLNELAGLYLDLSRGLTGLTPPKNLSTEDLASYDGTIKKLVLPFEEKGQDMREKAFEIASSAAIEDESFNRISEPFFAENPSQAKALKPIALPETPSALDLSFLAKADPSGSWHPGLKTGKDTDPASRLKAQWIDAIRAHRWPQISYFMQEAQEKALILAGPMSLVKAVSLATAGARGEALAELEEGRKDLNPISRNMVLTALIQYSLRACARDHTQALLKEVQPEDLNQEQASVVATASGYAKPGKTASVGADPSRGPTSAGH